jgi:hypothetical protein
MLGGCIVELKQAAYDPAYTCDTSFECHQHDGRQAD